MKFSFANVSLLGLGAGAALFGASLAAVGVQSVRKDFIAGGTLMTVGVIAARIGSQITIGAAERMTGKR